MTQLIARALVGVVAASLSVGAQQRGRQLDPNAIPVDKEPNHHLVFANEFVRVIDARFPPGHKTLVHAHMADNVAVTITTGRENAPGGRAGFAAGGYSHSVTNSGPLEQRFIDVEFLKSDKPGAPAAPDSPAHTLETENDRVRIYRVKLAPGESLASHRHDAGWIGVTVTGGRGPGTYQWHAGGTSLPLAVQAKDAALEIVELEPK
jgi:predicted metal-dependent enzyme (double-stranded beta helix superfamily)